MSMNFTGYNEFEAARSKGFEKQYVAGVGGSTSTDRLISTLERLELVEERMATACRTIAASNGDVKEFMQVSTYAVDRALAKTTASIEQRMAFKASLHAKGWLTQSPR